MLKYRNLMYIQLIHNTLKESQEVNMILTTTEQIAGREYEVLGIVEGQHDSDCERL